MMLFVQSVHTSGCRSATFRYRIRKRYASHFRELYFDARGDSTFLDADDFDYALSHLVSPAIRSLVLAPSATEWIVYHIYDEMEDARSHYACDALRELVESVTKLDLVDSEFAATIIRLFAGTRCLTLRDDKFEESLIDWTTIEFALQQQPLRHLTLDLLTSFEALAPMCHASRSLGNLETLTINATSLSTVDWAALHVVPRSLKALSLSFSHFYAPEAVAAYPIPSPSFPHLHTLVLRGQALDAVLQVLANLRSSPLRSLTPSFPSSSFLDCEEHLEFELF